MNGFNSNGRNYSIFWNVQQMAVLPGNLFKDSQSKDWNEWVESIWQLFHRYFHITQMPLLQVKNLAKVQKKGQVIMERVEFLFREIIGWKKWKKW